MITPPPERVKSPNGISAPYELHLDDSEYSDVEIRESTASLSLSLSNASFRQGDVSSWLLKRGNRYKSWKRRYFVMIDDLIQYYTDDTQSKKKGEIYLEDIDSCQLLAMSDSEKGFILKTKDRDWYCIAEDFDTKYLWTDHLASLGIEGDPLSPMERQRRELEEKERLLKQREEELQEKEKALVQSQKRETEWREAYDNLRKEMDSSHVDEELLDLYGINLSEKDAKPGSFDDTSELDEQLLDKIQQMRDSLLLEKQSSKRFLKELGIDEKEMEEEDEEDEEEEFREEDSHMFKNRSMMVFNEERTRNSTFNADKRRIEALRNLDFESDRRKRSPHDFIVE